LDVCRFFAGGADASKDSSLGAGRLFGNASEPRRDSGGAEPGIGVMRVFKVAAGASEGARELARELARAFAAFSFRAGTGVIDRGAGLLVRDGRFAAEGLHPDRLVS
jgi:hypothetical protein